MSVGGGGWMSERLKCEKIGIYGRAISAKISMALIGTEESTLARERPLV